MKQSPIIVGVDGSPQAMSALHLAAELAESTRQIVYATHVIKMAAVSDPSGVGLWLNSRTDAAARLELDCELATVAYSTDVRYQVVWGDPATALVEAARTANASCIVVGRHGAGSGHGRLTRLLLGSVSDHLARICDRPLLLVPTVDG